MNALISVETFIQVFYISAYKYKNKTVIAFLLLIRLHRFHPAVSGDLYGLIFVYLFIVYFKDLNSFSYFLSIHVVLGVVWLFFLILSSCLGFHFLFKRVKIQQTNK